MRCCMFAIVFLAIAAGDAYCEPPDDDIQQQAKQLEGTWTFSSAIDDGNKVPAERIRGAKMVFTKDKLVMVTPDGTKAELDYKLYGGNSPRWFDLINKGQADPGIYQIEKDILTICIATRYEGKDVVRPSDFKSTGDNPTNILTLVRERK